MKNMSILIAISCMQSVFSQVSFSNNALNVGISINCGNTYLGNGVSFFDYDNDGWDDITLASAQGDEIHFLKNINGYFVVQNLSIQNNNKRNKQINWVDIDNDGDNDLFVTNDNSSVKLYENLGNMIMQDITETSGMLTDAFPTYGASWGDYNNDGFLDVFLSIRDVTIPNILYRNNGDQTFTLVNNEVGLLNTGYMSFCSAFLDYDNDGDQDIYVSNDKEDFPNLLYKNNGDSTFTEVSAITGTNLYMDAMSVTVDDLNKDGWLDIYITNDDEDAALLINNQDGTFTDMAVTSQVAFNSIGWGASFIDADNDTDLDLYVSGETNGSFPQYLSSAFYENNGNSTFQLNNAAVPNDYAESYSNAIGDIDNDGYPEIVVNNINHDNIFLWKNHTTQTNNWLKVKLEGTISNRMGIGSFIEISINGDKQYRYTLCGEGYLAQNSATEMFGLGLATHIDYVKVKWLSGIEDIIYNVTPNQKLNIVEGSTLAINEYTNNLPISVFPNPFNNIANFRSKQIVKSVILFDELGRKVYEAYVNNLTASISLSTLSKGVYFANVTVGDQSHSVKLVKQ